MLTRFLISAVFAAGSLLAAGTSSAGAATGNTPDDYFHTGAGARYLVRAKSPLDVQHLRGDITVLMGSGGNITVLNGAEGKFLVDAGIAPSKDKVREALANLGPSPVKYVVNTHWHWDHTDGNAWLHAAGATIVAHSNTYKHLTEVTHVDDWNWTFQPVPMDARPTILVDSTTTFEIDGTKVQVGHFSAGHTDGDLWIYFEKADVVALGDTFWTGGYPFIDNEDGGGIDKAIEWANATLEHVTDKTILIPGHGRIGTRADLVAFRDMLMGVRDNVRALKQQGKSLDEVEAAKPTAAFDAKWGQFVIGPVFFTKLVYDGL